MGDYVPVRPSRGGPRGPKPRASAGPKTVSFSSEPTPEMIEAGVAVLWASGAVEGQLHSDELLVAEIFQAMLSASPPKRG